MAAVPDTKSFAYLRGVAEGMGRTLTTEQEARLRQFAALLLRWNERINLTGARTIEAVVGEHMADAVAMTTVVREGVSVVDVGSGGGLPALPFAILRPTCQLTLVEPRGKRAAFLRTAVRELRLPKVSVLEERLEDLEPGTPGWAPPFAAASSRATFAPPDWLRLASPLVSPEGVIVLFLSAEENAPQLPVTSVHYALQDGRPRLLAAYQRPAE